MGIVRISVRPDFVSRATDEFRELNFLMLTVGHAKSASGAPARCLHQFSRLDIFTMRRGVLTPALPENIGDGERCSSTSNNEKSFLSRYGGEITTRSRSVPKDVNDYLTA